MLTPIVRCFALVLLVLQPIGFSAAQGPPADVLDSGIRILADGEVFEYTKFLQDGRETTVFTGYGLSMNAEEMDAYEAACAPGVVDAELMGRASASPRDSYELTVWLRSRPTTAIARDVRRQYMGAIEELSQEIRDVHRGVRPVAALSPAEEKDLAARMPRTGGLLTQTQRSFIRERYQLLEQNLEGMRSALRERLEASAEESLRDFEAQVAELGGKVLGRILTQNAVTIRLPATQLARLADDPRVARVVELPPVTPELDNQSSSLGLLEGFWPDGIVGGLWDAGVLDTGVEKNHPAFANVTVSSHMGGHDPVGHGTACAGIIASGDERYRGTAYGLDKILVGSNSPELVMSEADWMVAVNWDDADAINLSSGYGMAYDTDYSAFDQFWDGLIDDNFALVATSAGNAGPYAVSLTHPAPAYNAVAVANMDDRNTVNRADDRIWSTSSRGPTLGGRKKPDLVAPGTYTMSTCHDWAGAHPDFESVTGTSAAAAHVTAASILLADLRGSENPMATKSVLLNTADAWSDAGPLTGSQWNPTYGWGYLDLWEAWYNGLDVFLDSVGQVHPGYRLYTGPMYDGEKATLVWNRHVGYNGSNYPLGFERLTDLDLVLYDEPTGTRTSASTSAVDNVEQVASSAPGLRTVVLKVDVFGSIDPDVGLESYALATEENFSRVYLPELVVRPVSLGHVSPNQPFLLPMEIYNPGAITTHDNALEALLPPGFAVTGGIQPWPVGSISALDSASATWTVRAPCSAASFRGYLQATHHSYDETSMTRRPVDVDVRTVGLASDTVVRSQAVPQTYHFAVVPTAWSVVALEPGLYPHDLRTDDDMCMGSPYQASVLPGTSRDFTVTNGHLSAGATHYTLVTSPVQAVGTTGLFSLEHEIARNSPYGSDAVVTTFDPLDVVEVFEAALDAGRAYDVSVEVLSGLTDAALFVFRGDRSSGSRIDADLAVNSAGAGGSEELSFVAPVSGVYAFVVVNENAQPSTLRFALTGDLIFLDGFESGDTTNWS